MEINSNIVAIGATVRDGIILLVAQSNMDDDSAPCVTFHRSTKEVSMITGVAKATTFNAFDQLDSKKSEVIKAIIERELTDEQIYNINTYLQDEKQI